MDRNYLQERRKSRRQKFKELLGGKCAICGSTKDLQFDHLDPSKKDFRISFKIDAPEDLLLKEINKCQLLCAKCHKKKTLEKNEFGKLTEHGTIWRYKKYKCRCDACRAAMSDYYFNRKKKLQELLAS